MNRQERNDAIVEMAKTGCTYEEIGQHFGVTRERVRQIIKPYGIDGATTRGARAAQKRKALDADRQCILDWAKHNPGLCAGDAEEALGLRPGRVRQALGADVARIFIFTPRSFAVRYTDEEIFEALRDAATLQGDPLSKVAYEEYVKAFGGPSGVLLMKRFGTWKKACRAAGLALHDHIGFTRRRWSQGQLVEVLMDYLGSPDARGSVDDYDRWAAADKPARPSGPLIRDRFGSWTAAKRAALAASAPALAA